MHGEKYGFARHPASCSRRAASMPSTPGMVMSSTTTIGIEPRRRVDQVPTVADRADDLELAGEHGDGLRENGRMVVCQ